MAQDFAKAFYNSKEWKEQREYVMKKSRYVCKDCGLAAEEVHHITKLTQENIKNPAITLDENNLVALCYNCHKKRHQGEKKKTKKKEFLPTEYEIDEEGNIIPPSGGT